MLSYQHGYHAGNHADVLKHSILSLILTRLTQKDRPLTYMDSHAGAGLYHLEGDQARKTGEADSGILKLLGLNDAPNLLVPYLSLCKRYHTDGAWYPGSPTIAAELTRPGDDLILMELHPAEHTQLKGALDSDPRAHVHHRDGFQGLVALSPPVHRRGLVLMDPSYETDEDYQNVAKAASALMRRWPEAVVAVWYPLVSRRKNATETLKKKVAECGKGETLCAELCPAGISDNEWGLYGSGMLVVNPPWKLEDDIAECIPWLTRALADDSRGTSDYGRLVSQEAEGGC